MKNFSYEYMTKIFGLFCDDLDNVFVTSCVRSPMAWSIEYLKNRKIILPQYFFTRCSSVYIKLFEFWYIVTTEMIPKRKSFWWRVDEKCNYLKQLSETVWVCALSDVQLLTGHMLFTLMVDNIANSYGFSFILCMGDSTVYMARLHQIFQNNFYQPNHVEHSRFTDWEDKRFTITSCIAEIRDSQIYSKM